MKGSEGNGSRVVSEVNAGGVEFYNKDGVAYDPPTEPGTESRQPFAEAG